MTAYRQSDAYTRELERRLGEAEKEISQLKKKPKREPLDKDVKGFIAVGAVFASAISLVALVTGAIVIAHGVLVDSKTAPDEIVLICTELDGPCVEMVEGER